jgi:tetratricopeptide (TPR) repeat protein
MMRLGGILFLILLATSPVFAQTTPAPTFEDGRAASGNSEFEKASEIFRRLARAGNSDAVFELGWIEVVKGNFENAVKIWEPNVNLEHPQALQEMGQFYRHGYGVLRDLDKAFDLFQRATKKGNPSAFVELGKMYLYGEVRPMNFTRAHELFIWASDFGLREGEYYLAVMSHKGYGMTPDYKMAHALYLTAAKEGSKKAAFGIAKLYKSSLIQSDMPRVESTAWRAASILYTLNCPGEDAAKEFSFLLPRRDRQLAGERAYSLLTRVFEAREFTGVTVEHFISLYVDKVGLEVCLAKCWQES